VGGENAFTLAISQQGNRLAYSQEFGDTNIWRIGVADAARRSPPVKLISSTRWDHGPQFSPDGKRIAFTSARSGNMEIWLCDADGLNLVQLTSFGDADAGSPRWSPDGRQIAFDCSKSGHREIYVVSAEGGRPRRLTEGPADDDVRPGWSRDGRWIYFGSNRGGDWQVWKAPVEGGQAVQVTQHGGREAVESGDGKYIYYNKGLGIPGIWKILAAGGEEVPVLEGALQGLWVLLDRGIYFVNSNTTPHPTIEFFNFASGQTTQIATIEKGLRLVAPSLAVSPDGQWILYAQVDSVESDIMLVENFR
jgi:Tol biopolymer transport system component